MWSRRHRQPKFLMLIVLGTCCFAGNMSAEEKPGEQHAAKLDKQVRVTLDYLLYLPKDYAEQEKWPLMLFLHGAGERGDDLEKVKKHGPPKLVAAGKDLPFVIVSPQCPTGKSWEPMELITLVDDVSATHKIDVDRIYVTGISMGGFGTWRLAAYAPKKFAAIVPICGGGEAYMARQFPHLPVWAFHGAKDPAVPLERSETMIEALKKAGGKPRFTVYPEALHDSWTQTYDNPEVFEWLLSQKRAE
jgi:predicted peptidase